jgi:beta-lactamase superfamily II metal-dependent hydrolase
MNAPLRFSLALLTASAAFAGSKDKTLDVYWIDSEGGGSTLIVTPSDESFLIDTGNPGTRDPGRIVAAAKAAGLTKIDHMAITHWHIDHVGGAAAVAQEIPFGTIYQRAIPRERGPDGEAPGRFQTMIKPFEEIQAKRVPLAPGITIPLKDTAGTAKLQVRVLGADQKFVEPTAEQMKTKNPLTGTVPNKADDTSDNANSAVFLVSFGGFKFFDGGDLTWNNEAKLVTPYNIPGVVDVYQTNHHGLEVSNNPVLLQSLEPSVVVMNNGPRKGGQPGTFAAMKAAAKSIQARYQIHKSFFPGVPPEDNAPDDFIANNNDFRGAEAANCPANIIKMSVAADGKSYTISIPATGHSRTYKTKG